MFYRSLLAVVLFLLMFSSMLVLVGCSNQSVDSSNEAIVIAQEYINKKYGQEFPEYVINTMVKDDIWIVWYSPPKDRSFGGGGPEIHIDGSNGRVISCTLQK